MSVLVNIFEYLINAPIVMLVLMALPLLAFARRWKVYPAPRLLVAVTIPAVLSVMMVFIPYVGWYVAILDAVVLLLALIDLATLPSEKQFSAIRRLQRIASLAQPHEVEIELSNHSRRGCRVTIKDDLPQCFHATPKSVETVAEARSRTRFRYHFNSTERGQQQLEYVHLEARSRLELWHGYYRVPCTSTVNVFPDMKQITEYDLLAKTNRLNLMGLRRTRRIGQDNEFERLRDYTQDDNYKHIDWRSTARRRKLTVRDFQANQSQRIIFLVDCGRMMTGTVEGLSLLDYSLNATLMLSYIALRRGDSVGLISFSNTIHNYTPPRAGVQHINRLLHATYNLRPAFVESRYDEAFLYLRTHCRKRALVILVTNVIDEINALQIRQYLGSLTGRHLPLGVLIRDRELFDSVEQAEPHDHESIYQAAAAVDVLGWRHQVIKDLQHQGVLALDLFPEQLTSEMINQYLEIKARHLL